MRTKSFAMLALSSLLATSLAYVAPAMADESTSGDMGMEMLADNSTSSSMPTDNSVPAQSGTMSPDQSATSGSTQPSDMNTTSNPPSNGPDTANVGAPDQGAPDTATGDDDY